MALRNYSAEYIESPMTRTALYQQNHSTIAEVDSVQESKCRVHEHMFSNKLCLHAGKKRVDFVSLVHCLRASATMSVAMQKELQLLRSPITMMLSTAENSDAPWQRSCCRTASAGNGGTSRTSAWQMRVKKEDAWSTVRRVHDVWH